MEQFRAALQLASDNYDSSWGQALEEHPFDMVRPGAQFLIPTEGLDWDEEPSDPTVSHSGVPSA